MTTGQDRHAVNVIDMTRSQPYRALPSRTRQRLNILEFSFLWSLKESEECYFFFMTLRHLKVMELAFAETGLACRSKTAMESRLQQPYQRQREKLTVEGKGGGALLQIGWNSGLPHTEWHARLQQLALTLMVCRPLTSLNWIMLYGIRWHQYSSVTLHSS